MPPETTDYHNLYQWDCFIRNFMLDNNHLYWYYVNASVAIGLKLFVIESLFYERVVALNGTSGINQLVDRVMVLERPIS